MDFNELKQLISAVKSEMDSFREEYDRAVFELASFYMGRKQWVECCSFLVDEDSVVSNEPLFVMALFEFFKGKNLLIESADLERFSFAALTNLLKKDYLDPESPPEVLLVDLFKSKQQIQKKRQSAVDAEELQDELIDEAVSVSTLGESSYSLFGSNTDHLKRRKLFENTDDDEDHLNGPPNS